MAPRSWSRSLLVAVAALAVSGCIDLSPGGLVDFEPVAAPTWEAGFAWTWTATAHASYVATTEEGTHESSGRSTSTIAHEVVGTAPIGTSGNGYVVRRDGGLEDMLAGALFEGESVVLVDPSGLAPVAYSYMDESCLDPTQVRWSEYYHGTPWGSLRFPTENGASWSGTEDGVAWKAEVLGQELVRVPAGSFHAVLVEFTAASAPEEDMVPQPQTTTAPEYQYDYDDYGPEHEDLQATIKLWYSEAARNVVRIETDQTMEFSEGDESMRMQASGVMELQNLTLTAEPGQVYPAFHAGVERPRPPTVHMVADKEFPLNAAAGDRNVTFGLAPGYGNLEYVEAVVPLAFDEAWDDHVVRWVVRDRSTYETVAQGEGATLTAQLPPGGQFRVQAMLTTPGSMPVDGPYMSPMPEMMSVRAGPYGESPYCGFRHVPHYGLASEEVEVYWAQEFSVDYPAGLPGSVALGAFEVASRSAMASISFDRVSDVPVLADDVHLRLVSPDGNDRVIEGTPLQAPLAPIGSWDLEWVVQGVTAAYGPHTVAIGHKGTVHLEIRYAH